MKKFVIRRNVIKHYKVNPDGSLRFVGNETTTWREPVNPRDRARVIDAETMQKINAINYDGQINPDDREV